MSNRLAHSTSPYLLQHAHNPVDWFEWGKEALDKAIAEDKPILVSIGYSACHWCHVMERECFEKQEIAAVMNQHFICIKVDREERPDVDQVYMEAVQAMGVNGGWPLNVFLTPDQKPFYGGTYFPPANWTSLLKQISDVFRQRRQEIDRSAGELTTHLNRTDLQRFAADPDKQIGLQQLDKMFAVLTARFDKVYGGMDKAPKFVMPTIWLFTLRYFEISKKQEALDMVDLTLHSMTAAGLYDQTGGGFARYSVDGEWFAPHFEKMLYDNAQLLSLYAEMYRITKDDFFRTIISECTTWLEREMTHPEGGFYSALDADSEGIEGKFYTWTFDEAREALGDDFESASKYFHIDKVGNWEHGRNILMKDHGDTVPSGDLQRWKDKLMLARAKRVRPGLDDKILAGWNAMTVKGLVDAASAAGDERILNMAIKAIDFIESRLMEGTKVYRSYKGKHTQSEGFLEDYAFLIQAYIALHQSTLDEKWIIKARNLCDYVMENFYDEQEGYFYFSSAHAEPLIARKKEIFDNVIPASNSVMATNLFILGTLFDNDSWKALSKNMLSRLVATIEGEPGYLSNWGILLAWMSAGVTEVVLAGDKSKAFKKEMETTYLPFVLFMESTNSGLLPLTAGKGTKAGDTTIFVCRDKTCKLPVTTSVKALEQITGGSPNAF